MGNLDWLPQTVAAGAVAILLLNFVSVRSSRRALAATTLPLALLPVAVGWLVAVFRVIRGFREMALAPTGGMSVVGKTLLTATETARAGHWSSSILLGVALVLSGWGWLSHCPKSDAPSEPRRRGWVVLILVSVSVVAAVSVAVLGMRCLVVPLPVLALEMDIDPALAPFTARASAAFEFGQEGAAGLGAASLYIARTYTTASIVSIAACGLMGIAAVLLWILNLGARLSRTAALVGLCVAALAVFVNLLEAARLRSLDDEIRYIVGVLDRASPPRAPDADDPPRR